MKIFSNEIYHIYNQGNNREKIFHKAEDYLTFLTIVRKTVFQNSSILAWCLMPNHFHFLIYATEHSAKSKIIGNIVSCELSNAFRLLQSEYAQFINKKYNRSGSLFRQKAQAKSTAEGSNHYHDIAFNYIHQNPLKAGIVNSLGDWPYSSYQDYLGKRNGNLCDKLMAEKFIGINYNRLEEETLNTIPDSILEKIFLKRK